MRISQWKTRIVISLRLQITVSSGGMLLQKLNVDDLQSATVTPFDGTPVYAQQKRQQVVMTEEYAKKYPEIYFSSMHPGWADTPGNIPLYTQSCMVTPPSTPSLYTGTILLQEHLLGGPK